MDSRVRWCVCVCGGVRVRVRWQSTGLVAKGSVTLSEDEKLLYVVAANSVAKAVFYALHTGSGTEAWRYTASFSLQGISEPVVYESAVVMGDSRVPRPTHTHTRLLHIPPHTRVLAGGTDMNVNYVVSLCVATVLLC